MPLPATWRRRADLGASPMTRAIYSRNTGAGGGVLDLYLHEIKDDRLLTAYEECSLAEAIASGDSVARCTMIQSNLRLVVKIAREYVGRGLSLEDLVGEGNLGLIRAAKEYDPTFGTRFSTYASYWIKQAIRHALTNTTATIRLPAHMVGLLTKWRRTERALSKELGQAPTDEQIAVSLGLTESQRELIAHAKRALQVRSEGGTVDDGGWSADESPDHVQPPDELIEAADERINILRRLDRLDRRERAIVSLRYGLEGNTPMTLKEVGKRMGVTREWVRKLEIQAVRKLTDDYVPPVPEPKTNPKRKTKQRCPGRPKTSRVAASPEQVERGARTASR